MARGKKTGGRNFAKGHHTGRKKGSKDAVPRSFKASIKAVFADVASTDPALITRAIRKGLAAAPPKSFPYLQLAAYYIDGKPAETVRVQPDLSKLSDEEFDMVETLMAKATRG